MNLVGRITSVSDRTLTRALRASVAVLTILISVFGVVYYMGQHVDRGSSLVDRQVQAAEQAVRKTPTSVLLRLQLAQLYVSAKNLDSALKQYDETLKIDPMNRAGLLGRGGVLVQQEKFQDATLTFQKVVSASKGGEFSAADPQLALVHYMLGDIALKQGNAKDAIVQLEAAVKIEPTDADAWFLLGRANFQTGSTELAIQGFRRALAFVPTGWCDPYSQLSMVYTKLGRIPEAEYAGAMVDFCENRVNAAKKRLETLTSSVVAIDAALGLGMISERESDRASAIKWYKKVLLAEPKNFNALTGLSRLGVEEVTKQ